MRLVVTGAAGFVGGSIASAALEEGADVVGLDRSGGAAGSVREWHRGDTCDGDLMRRCARGADVLVHAAGVAHAQRKPKTIMAELQRGNVDAALSAATAAAAERVRHFVLVSSVSVYGRGAGERDESHPCVPTCAYGKSKWQGENVVRAALRGTNTRLTVLRLSTVCGEGDRGSVARLIRLLARRSFVWVGNGRNRKTLVHIDDVASACMAAVSGIDRCETKTFNIVGGTVRVEDIVRTVCEALGRPTPAVGASNRMLGVLAARVAAHAGNNAARGPLERLRAWLSDDIYSGGCARLSLGWEPRVSIDAALRRETAWIVGGPRCT